MKPNKTQLLHIAKLKGEHLQINCQILLSVDYNYWLFNNNGSIYVGYYLDQPEAKLLPFKEEVQMANKENKVIAKLQKIKLYPKEGSLNNETPIL